MNNDEYLPRSGKVITPGGSVKNEVENVTGGRKVISTDHGNIHQGEAYSAAHKFTIADSATAYLQFTTDATKYVHLKYILWHFEYMPY